ncbi:hypothetical protein KEM56_005234 [Ascosphaera pollenicola]|nr:hypothetical protein KEM56_005234 [Ascosphaera pollenicola]
MSRLKVRDLLDFPTGADEYDTVINGEHLNLTTLRHFEYTLYSNDTISNGSKCYLTIGEYKPFIFENGTWVNATSCYDPIYPVGTRGRVGVIFASLFAISIMFTLVNLKKHGTLHLAVSKRFAPVSRRWQWYWMLALAAFGCISGFMSIDVDRNYCQSMAIMLQCFFFYLMVPIMLAIVWEGVRHWRLIRGSWQERQICDADNYAFDSHTTRERQEFFLPLIFYLFTLMNFLLTAPRSWTHLEKQRSPDQTEAEAKPAATDIRFKAASIFSFLSFITILYGLGHSIYRYTTHPRNKLMKFCFYPIAVPFKYTLCLALLLIRLIYGVISVWNWRLSPAKYDGDPAILYGLGYTPALLIIIILNIWGYFEENEEKLLIQQREQIDLQMDNELGIDRRAAKPVWWKRMRPDYHPGFGHDANGKLRTLVMHVGGGAPTQKTIQRDVEMTNIEITKRLERTKQEEESDYYLRYHKRDENEMNEFTAKYHAKGSSMLEDTDEATAVESSKQTTTNSSAECLAQADAITVTSARGSLTSSVAHAQPQNIRSMLDP